MADQLNPTHQQIAEYLTDNIISEMTQYLMEDYGYSLEQALDIIYTSHLMTLLQNEEGELYVQSPSYNYELLLEEMHLYPKSGGNHNNMVAEGDK